MYSEKWKILRETKSKALSIAIKLHKQDYVSSRVMLENTEYLKEVRVKFSDLKLASNQMLGALLGSVKVS